MNYLQTKMRIIFTILIFILFASFSFASEPPASVLSGNREVQKENIEKKQQEETSTIKHIASNPSAPLKREHQTLQNQEHTIAEGKNIVWYSLSEWWMVIVTAVLVLITASLAWYTSRLYKATVALSKEAQKTSERQTNLERPWLFMEKVRVERREGAPIKPEIPNNWYISFIWRNIGRSPALIAECTFKIEETSKLPESPDYANAGHLTCPSSVAAGVEFETSQVGPAPEKGIKDGEPINLTIFGRLTYKELNGEVHHTGFAMDVSPHLPAASTSKCKKYEYFS